MDCQCVINSRRWQSVMEEVDKGYSKFCVTFVTATRSAGILIHSRLKVLAVNLSWPSGRLLCMLASLGLTTLAGSKQTLLSVRILLLLSHGGEWVSFGTSSLG